MNVSARYEGPPATGPSGGSPLKPRETSTIRRPRADAPIADPASTEDPAGPALPPVVTAFRQSEPRAIADPPPSAPEPHLTLDGTALLAELDALGSGGLDALLRGQSARRVAAGDRVEGTVARVTSDTVFVDIGAKSEAILERAELDGPVPVVGEPLVAFVLSTGERGIRLARRLSGHAGLDMLQDAREAEIPVEGRVESRNAGGFVVRVSGTAAFCPASQIDRVPDSDPDHYLGLTALFLVTDIRGKDVVVSRRAVLDRDAEANAARLWETLAPGDALDGQVSATKEYGVFVDVGGLVGLVHKSELGWDPEALPPARGDRVRVRVVEVDREARKLSLSLRDSAVGPWSRVGTDFLEGGVYPGKITRLVPYGAFVSIAPGLEGLVHISNLAERRVDQPAQAVRSGQDVMVRILGVDHERQRLDLGIRQATDEGEMPTPPAGATKQGPSSLGTMADLFAGVKIAARAAPARADPARAAPAATPKKKR